MKQQLEKLIKNLSNKRDSASIIITHPKQSKQELFTEQLVRKIMKIPTQKSHKVSPDVFGIWPENVEKRSIKIEQIHEFIRKTQFKPFGSPYKIGVIIQSEMMTQEAQNAILKTLEEPPQNTFLFLTTSNTGLLLPTIVSRCQVHTLAKEENKSLNQELVDSILHADIIERFKVVEKYIGIKDAQKRKGKIMLLFSKLLAYFREIFLNQSKSQKNSKVVLNAIMLIESSKKAIESNVNTRLVLESLMINLPTVR